MSMGGVAAGPQQAGLRPEAAMGPGPQGSPGNGFRPQGSSGGPGRFLDAFSRSGARRWGACLALVLIAHAAAMFWLRRITPPPVGETAPPPAVMIDLAPEAVAPPVALQPVPPQPTPVQPQPAPPVPVQPPPPPEQPPQPEQPPPPDVPPPPPPEPAPPPEVVLPVPPPPPPPVPRQHVPAPRTPPRLRPVPQTAAPPRADAQPAPLPTAPAQSAQAAPKTAAASAAPPPGHAAAGWESAIAAHVALYKRYPVDAQRRGDEGVALVRFRLDRSGHVLGVELVRSSGHSDLDHDATAWIERADPFPAPPNEVAGSPVELVIPLRFSLR